MQQQINAERERMLADRTEVEQLLAGPLTESADGMAAAWRLLVAAEQAGDIRWKATREATAYMAERLSRSAEIASYRRMAETLSWDRRRRYLALIDGIEELRAFSDPHCIKEPEQVLMVIRRLADDFEYCLPKTSDCFVGLWRRAPKGMSFADHVKDRGRVPGDPLIGLEDS